MSSHPRAFTLTELILVVAIIAVLVGIAVPVAGRVRHLGRVTGCLSNLRQVQMAHMAWVAEKRGRFVEVGLGHGGADDLDATWVHALRPYYDDERLLRSPLDRSSHWPPGSGPDSGVPIPPSTDRYRRSSYGRNNFLSATLSPSERPADRLSAVVNPAATVDFLMLAFSGPYGGSDHVHVETWVVPGAPDESPALASAQVAIAAVGGPEASWESRANWGFLDGRSATHRFAEVFRSFERNRMDPEVAAKTVVMDAMSR